jgi:RNA 2',3'-cyclic 3'-phosphodiesterase
MRLFVALDLSPEVREAIAQFAGEMRRALPDARWVRPEGIHVTLKFIGEVTDGRVPGIAAALEETKSSAPVDLQFSGAGFFPNERRPRVFWIGVHASSNLAETAADIDSRLSKLGIPAETREFRPHLTLARLDNIRGIEKLHAALQSARPRDFGSVRTSEMHLYRSELGRGGARYTVLQSFAFAPQSAA